MQEQSDQRPQFLVETDWLAAHLDDAAVRIFDCTTHLIPDPPTVFRVESGRADYDKAHIPGAGFLDLQGELSDRDSDLRFTFPSAEQFAAAMAGHGAGDDVFVVLYSTDSIWWATRIWWMLRAFGFDNAVVLNGGWQKWQAEGRPASTAPCAYPAATFTPRPRPGLIADKDDVLAAIGDADASVINALRPDQHRGDSELHYGRPGRIANSVNVPSVRLVDPESNVFVSLAEMRARFEGVDALAKKKIISYCGGGIAASATAFALTMLGHENVSLYDASLSEWVRDPALPMETG